MKEFLFSNGLEAQVKKENEIYYFRTYFSCVWVEVKNKKYIEELEKEF